MTDGKVLEGRVALVTGASRGLGYASALGLAKAGAHVIALARTTGGLEDLDDEIQNEGGSATLVPLDLTDFEALERLADSIAERWGKLDIMFGNAAMLGTVTPLSHLKTTVFDDIFALNVTANFRLIKAHEALLKASDTGRALFVTSGAVRSRRAYVGPYAASKAALEAMVISWAREHQNGPLRANLLDPGTVRTKMRAQYAPGEDPETVTKPEELVSDIVTLLSPETTKSGGIWSYPQQDWLTL